MTRVTSACAVVLALTGCGGSATPGSSPSDAGLHESNAHDAVSEAMPSDAGADDSGDAMTDHATSTVAIGGTVIAQNSGGKPVAGASVCAFEGKPCVQTAADGSFAVEVPAFANTGIAMSRSGYGTVLLPLRTASTSDNALVLALPLLADQTLSYAKAGATFPSSQLGFVLVQLNAAGATAGFASATATLSPSSGVGPVYYGTTGVPDPALTSTSQLSLVTWGNVGPGTYDLSIGPSGVQCARGLNGWPATGQAVARIPVRAGEETRLILACSN